MSIKNIFWCDECGKTFDFLFQADEHEKSSCVPYKVGDPVSFHYSLLTYPAKITKLGDKVGPGGKRIVYVQTDEQIEEPEDLLHTGKDFFAQLCAVSKLETVPS